MTDEQFEKQWKLYGELRLAEDEEYKALKNNTFVFRWYDTVALVVCYVLGDLLVTRFIQVLWCKSYSFSFSSPYTPASDHTSIVLPPRKR